MAAGENQPQPIVRNFISIVIRLLYGGGQAGVGVRLKFFFESSLTPDAIYDLVSCCLDDPGTREFRDALSPPLVNGGRKSLLGSFFGHFKVTVKPNQSGHNSTPVRAINRIHGRVGVRKHGR